MTDHLPNETPPSPTDEHAFYSTTEAARLLGVCNTTVQVMVEKGQLTAWKTLGGHRRISKASVDTLIRTREPVAPQRPTTRPMRVLVAEDDPALRQLYQATIEGWALPLEVITASDGLEALVFIERYRPEVLITDLNMAPIDGFKLVAMLRSHAEYNRMQIVVVTGLADDDIKQRGGVPPGIAVYRKPAPFAKIQGFIEASALQRTMATA